MAFQLHPQLEKDCFIIGKLTLCRVLMLDDSQYPWFILVPEVNDIAEIYQLSEHQQRQYFDESLAFSKNIMNFFKGDKLNVAALGNVVPQLHIHHIVRYKNDACWPAPVWGAKPAISYDKEQAAQLISQLQQIIFD